MLPNAVFNLIPNLKLVILENLDRLVTIETFVKSQLVLKIVVLPNFHFNFKIVIFYFFGLIVQKSMEIFQVSLDTILDLILVTLLDDLVQVSQLKYARVVYEFLIWHKIWVLNHIQSLFPLFQ
jgi:hypothetical protein